MESRLICLLLFCFVWLFLVLFGSSFLGPWHERLSAAEFTSPEEICGGSHESSKSLVNDIIWNQICPETKLVAGEMPNA
uniref:Uncharacterized protein n=1 Tax=Echeneis naucrates TaxID=173247 RepID=A0A665ST94_ECHNA